MAERKALVANVQRDGSITVEMEANFDGDFVTYSDLQDVEKERDDAIELATSAQDKVTDLEGEIDDLKEQLGRALSTNAE